MKYIAKRNFLKFNRETFRLKENLITIVEEGRREKLTSKDIVDEIFKGTVIDKDVENEDGDIAEDPVTMEEIFIIAKRAIEQAEFEGGLVVLPTGGNIRGWRIIT